MAYQENGIYQIVSNRGNGPALSVYGNSQVSNNRNVIVWSRQIISDQKWQVGLHRVNGAVTGGLLKSVLNTAYGLNIWRGSSNTNNCDIYPLAGNVNDSLLDFLTIDASQNLYRIKLINYNLYLTASGTSDGADVRWQPLNTASNLQVWKFDTPNSGGGGSSSSSLRKPVADWIGVSQPYQGDHKGIDYGAANGTEIKAAAAGTVIFTQTFNKNNPSLPTTSWETMGNCMFIQHPNFGMTLYMHMNAPPMLSVGTPVYLGQTIGYVGESGNAKGFHLHFGFKLGSSFKDNNVEAYNDGTWKNPADYIV